jgi:hypothetical protein
MEQTMSVEQDELFGELGGLVDDAVSDVFLPHGNYAAELVSLKTSQEPSKAKPGNINFWLKYTGRITGGPYHNRVISWRQFVFVVGDARDAAVRRNEAIAEGRAPVFTTAEQKAIDGIGRMKGTFRRPLALGGIEGFEWLEDGAGGFTTADLGRAIQAVEGSPIYLKSQAQTVTDPKTKKQSKSTEYSEYQLMSAKAYEKAEGSMVATADREAITV